MRACQKIGLLCVSASQTTAFLVFVAHCDFLVIFGEPDYKIKIKHLNKNISLRCIRLKNLLERLLLQYDSTAVRQCITTAVAISAGSSEYLTGLTLFHLVSDDFRHARSRAKQRRRLLRYPPSPVPCFSMMCMIDVAIENAD